MHERNAFAQKNSFGGNMISEFFSAMSCGLTALIAVGVGLGLTPHLLRCWRDASVAGTQVRRPMVPTNSSRPFAAYGSQATKARRTA